MDYEKFLNTYSIDYLSSIDLNIHNHMLDLFLEKTKNEEFVFFDVGCNAGSFIRAVKEKNINAKIHAFEPHPYLFKYLKEKYSNEIINEKCVSNKDGNIIIHIPSVSVATSSIINRPLFQDMKSKQEIIELKTESVTIDSYMKNNKIENIDFIKIDVEGAEFFVFDGARKALKENKIICGQFEIGIDESGYTFNDIKTLLNGYGYTVENIFKTDCFFYISSLSL